MKSLVRKSNWPTLLWLFIEEKRNQPFAWGTNDCCMNACDWLTILTGVDPATVYDFRGAYATKEQAAEILKNAGGLEMVVETWSKAQGWGERPLSYAQRGDLVIFPTPDGPSLGVCCGQLTALAGRDGLQFEPTLKGLRCWHIPSH